MMMPSLDNETKMLSKKSIKKTKDLFFKTLKSLKNSSFISHDHNLPKTLFRNPLSCASINERTKSLNDNGLDTTNNSTTRTLKAGIDNDPSEDVQVNVMTSSYEKSPKMKKVLLSTPKTNPNSKTSSCRYTNDHGTYGLAKRMKDLDMMEVEELDHVLDVEEALNYYSRLNCRTYVDIVDKFFMDMYEEFLLPQVSVNLSSSSVSSRRLGPLKL